MTDASGRAGQKLNVFISYSRQDMAFVDRLQDELAARGIEAFVDREDIEKGEEWWARIKQLILEADTILFVLSPGSVDSKVCRDEVDYAEKLNKRFVPIVARDLEGRSAPPALARLNYIFFFPNPMAGASGDFDHAVGDLVRALEIDIPWIREHTRLGALAERWQVKRRPGDLLLRGAELATAERWLTTRPEKAPDPTDTHRALITLSRQAATRRQRWWVGGSLSVALGAVALAGLAYWQRNVAIEQRDEMLRRDSLIRAEQANVALRGGDAATATLLALEGLPDAEHSDPIQRLRPRVLEAESALYSAQDSTSELRVLSGHRDAVRRAVFSPDGRLVASASNDGTARLWELDTGKLLFVLKGREQLASVAFSPDGKLLATGSIDETRIWDAATGKELHRLEGQDGTVVSLSFSGDGRLLMTGSDNPYYGQSFEALFQRSQIGVWDVESGKMERPVALRDGSMMSAAFLADNQLVAITTPEHPVPRLWNLTAGDDGIDMAGHQDTVSTAVLSPDGRLIASGSGAITGSIDNTARVADAKTGKPLRILRGHSAAVFCLAFSPSGALLATGSADGTVRIWEPETGKQLHVLGGHLGWVLSVAFAPDGKRLVTASDDLTVRVWEIGQEKAKHVLKGHSEYARVAFSPDSRKLVTASGDHTAIVWDAATGRKIEVLSGHHDEVNRASFSPDGKRVLTSSDDDTVRLWDVATGKALLALDGHCPAGTDYGEYGCDVDEAVFSPAGDLIASRSDDGTVRLWDAASGASRHVLKGHRNSVTAMAFSPDGKLILTGGLDATARLWEVETGRSVHVLEGHEGTVSAVSFSPDGKSLVTGSGDDLKNTGTARIWDVESGKPQQTLRGHEASVVQATFSPDGKYLLTRALSILETTKEYAPILWDASTGNLRYRLDGHSAPVLHTAFSRDGRFIITVSMDRTAVMWEAESGKQLYRMPHNDNVIHAAFSPDGQTIATASREGTARLWRVPPRGQTLIEAAKVSVPRCLTKTQRVHYGLDLQPPVWCVARHLWPYTGDALPSSKGDAPERPKE